VRALFIALPIFIVSVAGHAASLDLKGALSAAHAQSPELQRAQSRSEEAKWREVESYSLFLPKIEASGNYLLDYKYMFIDMNFGGSPVTIPNIVPTTIFDVKAQWSLWDGWASTNHMRAASAAHDAAQDELKWEQFKLNRTVILEYYRALASKELVRVAESNLKTLQDHLRDVRLFRKSGVSTNYDVLRVEVQVSEAESEIINSKDNLAIAEAHLAEVLGQEEAVEPQGKLPELKADLADKAGKDIKSRVDLQALGERVQSYDYAARAAGRHWLPRFSAFGVYQYYNNRNDEYDDWDRYRNAYQVGLNLTWDLFDGFSDVAKRHEAIEQRTQSEKALRAEQLKSKIDGERWSRKFRYFSSVFKARVDDIEKSQESVRLARQGRKVGARTNTDLLDAETELFRAQAGAVTAQLGAIEALINLELSTGQSLYSFE
jgi:outer membrane protein TolC